MKNYLDLLDFVLENGEQREDRTGTGTLAVFDPPSLRFDLTKGFPAVTTKKLFFKGVKYELLWMLKGETNIKWLNENGVHIWDGNARPNGTLGPIYGKQWRRWSAPNLYNNEVDQIKDVIERIKFSPTSRRHLVSAWNVAELSYMQLPPCHVLFQFYVSNDKKLSCKMYQRSVDLFLGCAFNIASYALLTHMVAQCTGNTPGTLTLTFGDAHIYLNHIEQVKEQLKRAPILPLPTLWLANKTDIDTYLPEDIRLISYIHHPEIKAEMSV